MNIERELTMTARKTIDLTHANATTAKLSECAGLSDRAAHNFRIMAHTALSRGKDLFIGATSYGEGIMDEDREIIDAGLVDLGKWEANPHPMAMSHCGDFPATFTAKGLALAQRTVKYEIAIRTRDMDADALAAWKHAVSNPNL
jgi:hypothetical protein